MTFKTSLRIIGKQFIFLLILFSLIRLLFLIRYRELFTAYSFFELFFSLLHGIRFDLSVICKIFGALNLLLFIPVSKQQYEKKKLQLIAIIGYFFSLFLIIIHIIDLNYYRIVGRRISFELMTMWNDFGALVESVLKDQKIDLFLGLFCIAVYTWIWKKLWQRLMVLLDTKPIKYTWSATIAQFLIALIFFTLGARGGLQAKPLSENTAFKTPQLLLGHLALNAPFTVLAQLTREYVESLQWLPDSEAEDTTRQLLTSDTNHFINDDFTFLRQNHSLGKGKGYNVVVLIMESWPAFNIGSLGGQPHDATPFFNQLSQKGVLFDHCFANGTRSIEGIAAILMSLPSLPKITLIMSTFEQNNMISLVDQLSQQNYQTLFLHGNFRGSFGLHQFAAKIGFQKVIAQEDFLDYQHKSDGTWGIWDHIQLLRLSEELTKLKQPFFSAFFSSSSHEPFVVPDAKFKYYDQSIPDADWFNALRYSDWSLEQFFQKSKDQPWFDKTLFIITSDHTIKGRADQVLSSARIPLLFYTPSGLLKPLVNHRIASQVDIVPSIIDFLGFHGSHASMGFSLFQKKIAPDFALFYHGTNTWIIDHTVYDFYDDRLLRTDYYDKNWNAIKSKIDLGQKDHHIQAFKAYLQSSYNAIVNNKIVPLKSF